MNLKAKLISTIAAVCLVVCLVTVGIWAAGAASIKIGGSVLFEASDVSVTITGSVSGNNSLADSPWNPTVSIAPDEADDAEHEAEWSPLTFHFVKDGKNLAPITITFTITNNGSIPLTAHLADESAPGSAIKLEYSNKADSKKTIGAGATDTVTITITALKDAATSITATTGAWSSILSLVAAPTE